MKCLSQRRDSSLWTGSTADSHINSQSRHCKLEKGLPLSPPMLGDARGGPAEAGLEAWDEGDPAGQAIHADRLAKLMGRCHTKWTASNGVGCRGPQVATRVNPALAPPHGSLSLPRASRSQAGWVRWAL